MSIRSPSESGLAMWELFSHDLIIEILGEKPTKTTSNYNKLAIYIEKHSEYDGTPLAEKAQIFRRDYQNYNKLRRKSKSGKIRSSSVDHSLKDANKFLQENFSHLTPSFVLNELRKTDPEATMSKNPSKTILKYIVDRPSLCSTELSSQVSAHLKNLQGYSLEEHHNFIKTLTHVPLQIAIDWHQNPNNNHCKCVLHPKIGHHFPASSYWNAHVLLEYHAKFLQHPVALQRFNKLLSQHHYRNRIEESATTTSLIQTLVQPSVTTTHTQSTCAGSIPGPLANPLPLIPSMVKNNLHDDVLFLRKFNLNIDEVKQFIDNFNKLCNEPPLTSDIRVAAFDDRERVLASLKFVHKYLKNPEAKQRYKRIQEQLVLEDAVISSVGHKPPELAAIENVSTEEAIEWFNSCVEKRQNKSLIQGCAFRKIDHSLKRGCDLDLKVRYNYVINQPCPSDPELKKAHISRVEFAKKGLEEKLNNKSDYEKQRQAKRQKLQ